MNRRGTCGVWLLAALGLLAAAVPAAAQVVRVGFVVDGPWDRNEEVLGLFRAEITDLIENEFDVRFPESGLIIADFTMNGVRAAVDRQLADPQIDIVVAMGVLTSMEIGRRPDISKPVIAPFVLDTRAQSVPLDGGQSGVRNLSYIVSPSTIGRELRVFRDIVPFRRLAFLANPVMLEEIPELNTEILRIAEELTFELRLIGVSGSAASVLDALPEDVDAVYMVPLLQLAAGDFDQLVAGLNERRLPTFSMLGRPDVERGVLAGLNSGDWFPRLARRTALNLQRILLGENPSTLPVTLSRREELVLNMATARAIGFSPSFAVLTEATLVNERRKEVARKISLFDAVAEAANSNLDLAAAERDVAAGSREVGIARSRLLPQVNLNAAGTLIDRDRAEASFGSAAQRSLSAGASLSQVLWSESAWANLSIQRNLQTAREKDRDQLRLDVIADAAMNYLNLLRAHTFEQIQKDNLKLTRSNLELAQIRRAIGMSGPSEVYRWRSQIAAERKSVIEANSRRNLAEIAVNRILHRPLEEPFATEEVGLGDPRISATDPRFRRFIGDPESFRYFRRFLVEDGLASSPELQQLDAAIAARERARSSAKASFFSPTVSLQGEVDHELGSGGAGSGSASLPDDLLPATDDTDWNLSLVFSIPLTTGGSRRAGLGRAGDELESLRIQRRALAERIEQRIRSAAHLGGASYAGIALTLESAAAANSNLELITDSYSRGAVQIIDLLDAQNASLQAELAAANASFDFLIDLMEVERSIGKFAFFASPDQREEWFQRLVDFYDREQSSR